MKLVLDDIISDEIKKYLLLQTGITKVKLEKKDFLTVLNIDYSKDTTPEIIMKHIELFQNNDYSILLQFDKNNMDNYKVLKYVVKDMCCEYCYKALVMDLYLNKKIKSVITNFDSIKQVREVEFIIEYSEDYNEKKLIEYIKDKYKY